MNIPFLLAAALCLFGAGFHELVGTAKIAAPIMNSELDLRVKTIAKIVWHSVTFILLFSGCALVFIGTGSQNSVAGLLIAAYAQSFAFLFWYCCRKFLGKANFFPHPWVFSAISLLSLVGIFL